MGNKKIQVEDVNKTSKGILVYRDYWNEDHTHTPYTNIVVDQKGIEVTQLTALENMFEDAGIEDGDEFEITITKTGKRPFGNRRVFLVSPHTYRLETYKQAKERMSKTK